MSVWKSLGLTSAVAAICVVGSLALPSTSFAHDPMYPKLNFHFRAGVLGDHEGNVGSGPTQRGGMDPSFGGGVELEVPLNPAFSLGAAFEAYGWSFASDPDRYNVSLDFLFMPRFRIPFGAHPWHAEVYFGLPIGPTVSLPHERFMANGFDTGFGVTGGGRVGFRINVNDLVGFYIDAGPMIQYVEYPARVGSSSFDVWHYQLVLRAGGSFGLGGG